MAAAASFRTRMHRALDRMIDAVPPNISKGAQAMATRMNNAEAAFIETLMRHGKISRPEAEKAMRTMLRLKVAKLDAVSGVIRVKHGAYLEPDAIRNAVAYDAHGGRDARFDWEAHNDRDRVDSENARNPDMHQRAIRYHEDMADGALNGAAATAHRNAADLHEVAATSSYGNGKNNPQAILAARAASARANRMPRHYER